VSAITRGEEGDGSFGFAIADTELSAFLREAKQPYASVGTACTSIEERLRDDSEADVRARADALTSQRDAATQAAMGREEALARAREAAQTRRENVIGFAGLLLVLGAMGVGAAGLFAVQRQRRRTIWAAGLGGLVMVAAILVFVLRPKSEPALPPPPAAISRIVPNAPLGKLICVFQPERSRVTVSPTGDRWERVVVPEGEQTVSVVVFDPLTRRYTDTRYMLGAQAMAQARKLQQGQGAAPRCTVDPAAIERLAQQQAAIRTTLPPLPNEKLVYSCRTG
jgi:hypothetical protein